MNEEIRKRKEAETFKKRSEVRLGQLRGGTGNLGKGSEGRKWDELRAWMKERRTERHEKEEWSWRRKKRIEVGTIQPRIEDTNVGKNNKGRKSN